MKVVKILILFILFFVAQISAQEKKSKIEWKNLQEKYESFYDIKPIIVNRNKNIIYYRENWNINFEYFDKDKSSWQQNMSWGGCQPTKEKTKKLSPNDETEVFEKGKDFFNWYGLLCCDIVFNDFIPKNQTTKYRLVVSFYDGKKKIEAWNYSYSPEFEVIVRDFKKYFL